MHYPLLVRSRRNSSMRAFPTIDEFCQSGSGTPPPPPPHQGCRCERGHQHDHDYKPFVDLELGFAWGGWLIQPSVFLRKTGSAIKFRNALQVKRHLWVSPRIRASLPELVDVITSAVACPNSRWHLVSEIGEWVVLKQNATKNYASVVALVTEEEEQKFESVKHVFSAAAFLDFIKSVDKGKSTLGSCYM